MGIKHKIFVVDDHAVFREGLVQIINQEKDLFVCGEATGAADAIKQIESLKPDLVIVDISLEGMSGIDLTKSIRERFADARILTLSMHPESLYAERALRAGSNGYIMKRENSHKLVMAIRQVLRGHIYVSENVNELLLHRVSNTGRDIASSPIEQLTDREFEVFQFIGQGYGTRQIAEKLNLSMKTVESHREHIRGKLNLNTTFELVQRAIHWVHHEANNLN